MLANPLPLQTTYGMYIPVGYAGMPATQTGWDGDNRIVEDPTGTGIKFGLAVCQGYLSDKGCTLGQLSGGGAERLGGFAGGLCHHGLTGLCPG